MPDNNKIVHKPFTKRIIKTLFYLLAAWIILLIVAAGLFYIYKDDISKKLLLSFNAMQRGEISLGEISFKPFVQFPDISIGINNVIYYENKTGNRYISEKPIAEIDVVYASLNIIDLIKGRINISKVKIEGGTLNFVTYKDSSVNIFNALGLKKPAGENKTEKLNDSESLKTESPESDGNSNSSVKKTGELNLNVEQVSIKDLRINFDNRVFNRTASYNIKNLSSSFQHLPELIKGSLSTNIIIDSVQVAGKELLSNTQMKIEIIFGFDKENLIFNIDHGFFSFAAAGFNIKGYYDIKNDEYVNFEIDGSDHEFSFFALLFTNEGIKNLKKGDLYFKGTIKGKSKVQMPDFTFEFGLKDVEVINPVTNRTIKNLNLKGYFNSGTAEDLSEAGLKIDTLYADLPDGFINLSGTVKNFKLPEIDLNLYLNADVTGLDKLFNLSFIKNLQGKIYFEERIKGKYISEGEQFESEINNTKISFGNLGFIIPGALRLDNVNGLITRKNNVFYFNDLSIISEDTDLLINGESKNLHYLALGIDKEITASLTIKSSVFDLPNFLFFDPSIKRDFPYRILNVDLNVDAFTTTTKALNFKSFPEIEFKIKKLNATAENFLPPLEIKSGVYKISESLLGFNMKFDGFKTNFLNGKFNFTAEYNSSKYQPYYIKIKTGLKDVYPALLFYGENDTIPEALSGKLNGSFLAEVQLPVDSTVLKFIRLRHGDLEYQYADNIISTKSLNFSFSDVYFNSGPNSNPLATLSTKGKIGAEEIKSNEFDINDFSFNLMIQNGVYKVDADNPMLFGKNSRGNAEWIITPFTDIPSVSIEYNIPSFYAEELLQTFLEDTIITGKLNLNMRLNSSGNDWNEMLGNLAGWIKLSGRNLTLYGVDTDEILEKYKRSQNFNLVDLGAVMLAGPLGIAITKGTDFASILMFNEGHKSSIHNFVSNWKVEGGTFTTEDVAFTTDKNRFAAKGWLNFAADSLDLTIAVLDKNGCSIFSQNVFGKMNEPEPGKLKIVGTLLAPVTNLIDDIFGSDCEKFYTGSVKHPD